MDTDAVGAPESSTMRPEWGRLSRGGEGEVDETAHLAGLFFVDEEEWVEVLDLCGEADGWHG